MNFSKKFKRVSRQVTLDDSAKRLSPPPPQTLPRSSTSPFVSSAPDSRDDHGTGNALPNPPTRNTINVILFGETGVGKSSVINLIARKDIAAVSSDVNGCTMQYNSYDIPFDNLDFAIYDTVGLEEPQMGVNGYLKAIEKAYELISKLGAAGGIHLLLFCMRGGRITATTQSNYRLFRECLCSTKVPMALVFTGLEREVEMEDWWKRNKKHIEDYGIKSDGHACITAVQDDDGDNKFKESQVRIRQLLKECATRNDPFSPELLPWFARITRGMKSFVPIKKSPKKKDVMKVLTQRCKLDPETAKRVAAMMEGGDPDANKGEAQPDGQGNVEKEAGPEKILASDDSREYEVPSRSEVQPDRQGREPEPEKNSASSESKEYEVPQAGHGAREIEKDKENLNDDSLRSEEADLEAPIKEVEREKKVPLVTLSYSEPREHINRENQRSGIREGAGREETRQVDVLTKVDHPSDESKSTEPSPTRTRQGEGGTMKAVKYPNRHHNHSNPQAGSLGRVDDIKLTKNPSKDKITKEPTMNEFPSNKNLHLNPQAGKGEGGKEKLPLQVHTNDIHQHSNVKGAHSVGDDDWHLAERVSAGDVSSMDGKVPMPGGYILTPC